VACVSADGAEQLDRACTGELHFEFYLQSAPAAAATEQATEPPAASAFAEPGKLQVGVSTCSNFLEGMSDASVCHSTRALPNPTSLFHTYGRRGVGGHPPRRESREAFTFSET
jgi:hypothetical protein